MSADILSLAEHKAKILHDAKIASAELIEDAQHLVRLIKPLLGGHDPAVQGAVLADLVSIFFAGHRPDMREELIGHWMEMMRRLIPESEKEIFPHGKPEGWDDGSF